MVHGLIFIKTMRGPFMFYPPINKLYLQNFNHFVFVLFLSCLLKFSFLFNLKNHFSKDVTFKFQLKRSSRLELRSNFVYCSCLYLIV